MGLQIVRRNQNVFDYESTVIYKTFIALMIAIYIVLPATRIIQYPFNLAGIIIFLVGGYIAISQKKFFQKTNTPMPPSSKPNMLHTKGAFRYTRNPMYLGITIGIFGLAILMSSFINFCFPVLFLVIMDMVYIRREEKILEDEFGDAYLEYKDNVRIWI